jgi:predicted MFS family arabinose efflux permease
VSAPVTRAYKTYVLILLLVILAFNYVDRLALGLFLEPIKHDLALTDTQLGVLSGIAFAVFYAFMGIPIARWADRGNRSRIISLTLALWSAAVALCGTAGSFVQLLLIRIGVGIGEAGCIPPAHSLIADYFTRAERPRAVAIYMLGGPLSVLIGYLGAGWLNEFYGWRVTFMLLGVPGLALFVLTTLTLREPPREAAARERRPTLAQVCARLLSNRTYRHLLLAIAVTSFFNYGIATWQPTFFVRSFGLQTGELGTWLALIWGGGGLLGTYCGGEWATRCAAHQEARQLKIIAVVYACSAVISVFVYSATNRYLAFALLSVIAVSGYAGGGPLFATIQTLVPARMRAMSLALIYLFANLLGMGLGPLAAGAVSDALHAAFGEESLRYALLLLSPGYLWAGWHVWRASATVTDDLDAPSGIPNTVGQA